MPTELREELRDGALWLTIDRPERRNALTAGVIDALIAGFERADGDRGIRAIVLTGSGDAAFCAGADLKSGTIAFDYTEPYSRYAVLLRRARACNVPTIARVNGACMAGGIGLLAMCDLAFATKAATFGLPEVKVGLFPMQVLAVVARLVPRRMLTRLCLTGETIDAHEAREIGLLTDVVDDLDIAVNATIATLSRNSPAAIRRGLYALKRVETMPFEDAMAFTEGQIGLLALTPDAKEGARAFAEKRAPNWDLS